MNNKMKFFTWLDIQFRLLKFRIKGYKIDKIGVSKGNKFFALTGMALFLDKHGADFNTFEPVYSTNEQKENKMFVCQVGYSPKEKRWYGWGSSNIYSFGIGDEVKEGDLATMSGWTNDYLLINPSANKSLPVGFKAMTLDDCKKMAIAYAEAVG